MAMSAEHGLVRIRHTTADLHEELPRFVRNAVADRVGEVDGRGAVGDGALDDAAQKVAIAPGRVLRRELDIVSVLAGATDAVDDRLEAALPCDAQLPLEVQVRGGQKGVDALACRWFKRASRLLDVDLAAARQRGYDRPPNVACDLTCGFAVGGRGDGEARLDDVHAERVERTRQAQLRGDVHRESWRLLAVSKGRVEHDDAVGCLAHALRVAGWPFRSQSDN